MSRLRDEPADDDHFFGRADAPVVIVEYGCFADPRCGELYWELKRLILAADGRLGLIYRHFPLSQVRADALGAAEAAEAASAQGAFWDMHDVLFENQEDLDPAALFSYADELELDLVRFTGELDDHRHRPRIERDLLGGARSGVVQLPGLFVNGEPVPRQSLAQTLDALLNEGRPLSA